VQDLISIDIGGADSTGKLGPAAIGRSTNDFWNFYTRNDGHGGWLNSGTLGNLKNVEGTPTGAGMTIVNAPGAWGNGSSDEMYNSYNYPFDGGNVTITLTNLSAGVYDLHVYGIDSSYELTAAGLSYGSKPLPSGPVINPVQWQEGLQYVVFRAVQVTNDSSVVVTVRPGAGGYATISGLQISSPQPNSPQVALAIPPTFAPSVTTLQPSNITYSAAVLSGQVDTHGVPTSVWFEWGIGTNYVNSTPRQFLPTGLSKVPVSAKITGLESAQSYSVRIRATSPVGDSLGQDIGFSAIPSRPMIRSAFSPSGRFVLAFPGVEGASYIIEASTDLQSWTVLGVATDTGEGSFKFEDESNGPARFYRVIEP
ncbi:MAG TPA: hypothetical protein VN673_17445, partial [Clostridia bacterium]|nr:hypothetical protein [Clostridia bacterium]